MSLEEFWYSTPREFAAHLKLLEREDTMLATTLAALHNGPMIRKDERAWIPEMFLPGYVEAPPDPKLVAAKADLDMRLMKARMSREAPTPEQVQMRRDIAHRMQRARQASADGLSGEVIQKIMQGLA